MPELPDLEIVKEVLQRRIVGQHIVGVAVLRPVVLRTLEPNLSAEAFLAGRTVREVARRGKFLLLALDDGGWVAINCMLAGRLRLCPHGERPRTRDYLALHLEDGSDLRYHDLEGMGKIYLTHDLALVPTWSDLGPEATDPALTPEMWLERLARYSGEIKGVLTRGALVAGIGNAYADEILFQAGLYPFRKVSSLAVAERLALYEAMRAVLSEAVVTLRERVGDDIQDEVRDFLRVHNRKGQPCPRCGQPISEIKTEGRATDFCRRCQPGSLIRQ